MNDDRDLYGVELCLLIREALSAAIEGDFSAHNDHPFFSTRRAYDMFTEVEGLPLYPKTLPRVLLDWAKLDASVAWQKEDILVLDLETTGLGRGGTIAFMIGLGYYDDGQYIVEQIFLPEPEAECNSFDRLIELLEKKSLLITFNGKTFDIPVLESRILYHRLWLNLREKQHLDLLHIARRLWKNKLPSCALESIEYYIMGHIRDKELDIEGGDIPQTYFQFLINGDPELIRRIFVHNQFDILHTAALFALICDCIDTPVKVGSDHRIDYHALAKLYLSQGHADIGKNILIDLIAKDLLCPETAFELGRIYKKEKDLQSAESCFAMSAALFHPPSVLELTKLLEKKKEFSAAKAWTEKLLLWHSSRVGEEAKIITELNQRLARLTNKIIKAGTAPAV